MVAIVTMTRGSVDTSSVLNKPYGSHSLDEDYDLGQVLGKGAFGTVREAVNRRTGELLACKSIPKAKLVYPEDVKDVQREVAIMNHVAGHAHVVNYRVRPYIPVPYILQLGRGQLCP